MVCSLAPPSSHVNPLVTLSPPLSPSEHLRPRAYPCPFIVLQFQRHCLRFHGQRLGPGLSSTSSTLG